MKIQHSANALFTRLYKGNFMKAILILFLSVTAMAADSLEQEIAKEEREKTIERIKENIINKCSGDARTIKEQKKCITKRFNDLKLGLPTFVK